MKKRTRNKTTMNELLRSSPLSNASLSEIAGSLADLSRILREEFARSSTQSLQQLEQSVTSLRESVSRNDAVSTRSSEQLTKANALQDEAGRTQRDSQERLSELTAATRALWHVSRELRPALEACRALYQDDCAKRRAFEIEVATWSTGFNSRLVEIERKVARMEQQYRTLCSELRRLDDCGS